MSARKHKRKNYFEVLGVPSVASQLEIKKAPPPPPPMPGFGRFDWSLKTLCSASLECLAISRHTGSVLPNGTLTRSLIWMRWAAKTAQADLPLALDSRTLAGCQKERRRNAAATAAQVSEDCNNELSCLRVHGLSSTAMTRKHQGSRSYLKPTKCLQTLPRRSFTRKVRESAGNRSGDKPPTSDLKSCPRHEGYDLEGINEQIEIKKRQLS